jgi:hypothetical protein
MARSRDRAWQRGGKSSQSLGFGCCVRDVLTVLSGATRYFHILAFRHDTHGKMRHRNYPYVNTISTQRKGKNVVTRQVPITYL